MDPITQGLVGALAAQIASDKKKIAKASAIGALAGMAPDLDVLIRSSTDPLLFLEYHRHFTHSLFFIPIGGFLCALFFYLLVGTRWQLSFKEILIWSVLGFASHGLLDACTSYGTRLWWPFDDERVAWDLISVIDPLYSGVLLLFVVVAIIKQFKLFAGLAVAWVVMYFSMAAYQHNKAVSLGEQLALSRGHEVGRLHAKPSFGNIIVWKVIYESGNSYYIDAVKPEFNADKSWPGDSVAKLDITRDLPWLNVASQQAKDIERFREFSDDFLAIDPGNKNRIGDVRYSQLPNEIDPLWAIELSADQNNSEHAEYVTLRDGSREAFPKLLDMILE